MRALILITGLIAVVLGVSWCGTASAMLVTTMGYRAYEGGGGAISTGWTTGNLGNTWAEGEWIAYQFIFEDISAGLAGLDSIVVSFDFTTYAGGLPIRFLGLVRGLQVGTVARDDTQGWVAPGGGAFPVTTRQEVEIAQKYPDEEIWTGFTLLNLPYEQINRTLSGGPDVPDGEERHVFKIYRQDLLNAGINVNAATVVVYFQLHESMTSVWQNQLQAGYAAPPADAWGGYLYGTDGWPTAPPAFGSGYVPGSSGHVDLLAPVGSMSVPIPIPEIVSGAPESSYPATGAGVLALVGPLPNPADNLVSFSIEVNQASDVDVALTDVAGRAVYDIHSGYLDVGSHLFNWDLRRDDEVGYSPGIYFLHIKTGNQLVTKKVVLVR